MSRHLKRSKTKTCLKKGFFTFTKELENTSAYLLSCFITGGVINPMLYTIHIPTAGGGEEEEEAEERGGEEEEGEAVVCVILN